MMSNFATKNPLQKKGKGKCQKLANAKEDLNYVWNNSKYNEGKYILNEIYTANTLEAQISSLKVISKKIVSEPCYEKKLLVTEFLLELYFTLPTNSPLRTPLVRILSSMPDCIDMIIETIITERFTGKISTKTCELNEIMDLSTILFGFLENSMFKYFCAENLKNHVLNFLETSLIECHNFLLEEVPPTKKLIIINCIHNCVRCAITLLQKCSPNPSEKFYFIAKKLVIEEQLPSDTRSNCGMLYILLYKCLYQDISWDKLIYDSEELSYISQLCIISGLLNALKSDELKMILKWKNSDIPLLQILFKKILEIEESNPADSTLILGVSRCVHLVSKSLLNLPELLTENLLNNFLIYLWTHLEHYIDAIRHIASSTLSNIILIGKCNGKRFVFDIIVEETSKMRDEKKAKHVGIIALIGHVPINNLLQKSPGLIKKLLSIAENSSSVDQVVMTFESLMKQHFKETSDVNEWFKLWIDPLLVAMGNKLNDALEHIVTNAIKLNPEMIHYVISLQSLNEDENLKNIGIVLVCLRTSRKYGLLKFNEKNENWKGLLSYSLLRRCIYHSDVEIRMSSFSLLVECQKTTEHFIKEELVLFKLIFHCNINNQCPAIRQKTLALIKKFLSRFKDSYQSLMRSSNKIKQSSDIEKESIEDKVILNSYDEFKIWLMNFGVDNIFPGANFSRRGTSLNILLLCHEFGFWNSDVFTKNNAEVLLKCLLDPYEDNKIIAKNLLSIMPLEKIIFKDNHYVNLYLKSSVEMASSIRPPDSISAAYFISLLISFPQLTNDIVEVSAIEVNSVDNPFLLTFILLSIILNQLEKELAIANKSILKAASYAPMYGHIFVMRHILQGLQYRPLENNLEWKYIINRIINTAFKCNEVVSCVVNNSSPEGHLPMDFNCDSSFFAEEINTNETPVTAQMVLLCSWRTIKEVSLLLGEIVEQLSSHKDSILITKEQIVRIGNHLMKLLLETKHRGAFEQAYLGFCKLAGSLWKCSIGNLHELPFQWLIETLNAISINEKLSATRRSAGIPFIIQGLVCSELQVGSSKCLTIALNILFGLLNSAEASTDARAHALNILRALFRHHMLGEMVGPYVAQGLAIAINGFNSDTWAERNSSTLLLSALMVRIFGVPRSREKISWKNKLTGRIFFQRYPTLYGELLKHLKLASVDSLYPATYPVLLILGRLYPSPLEGTDSNLQLNTFIPFVSKCASSSILKSRTLAASAMVALISPHMYIDFINALFQDFCSSQNENRTHGLLLQVIKLLRHSPNLPEEYLIQRNLNMNQWFSEVTKLLNKKHSYIVKECCLKIIINCLSSCYQHISLQNLQDIIKILEIELFERKEEFTDYDLIGLNGFLVHGAIVLLLISYLQKSVLDFSCRINLCLKHNMYEVVATALDFISFILNNELCYDPDLNDVDPIVEIVDCNNEFKHYFMNDIFLSKIFINKLNHTCHHEDFVKLLNSGKNLQLIYEILLEENVSIIKFFTAICEESPAILGSYVIQWISSYVSYQGNALSLKREELDNLCGLLKHLSNPESNYECRLAVSNFMKNNFHTLIKCSSEVNYLTIWTCFLNLLNDDEAEVRVLMSSIFSSESVNCEVLQMSLDIYLKDTSVNNLLKAVGLISWAIGNFNSDKDTWEDNDRVFEKGDSNTYNEEFLICKIAINCLKKLYETDPSIHTTILPNKLTKWIAEECSFNMEFCTLQDLFHCYKKEANRFLSKPNGITPFRAIEMKKLILEQKINFMQEFMHF